MVVRVRFGRPIWIIWACGLVRLLFYASVLPLWEGVDEWSHFAVVRAVALQGQLLPAGVTMPRDIEASLNLAPVPWEYRRLPAPSLTEDLYWQLPAEARRERETSFRAIPAAWALEPASSGWPGYETQQPPLYYWLTAPLVRLMRGRGLADQVMAVRWFGVLIASLAIPLVYLIGKQVFGSSAAGYCCAAVLAVMPGFAYTAAHVGNDGLAVVLFTALIWLGLREERPWLLGIVLGLGLLTKAYFLTAILALGWLLVIKRRDPRAALIAGGCALPIAGWWYVRNILTTGTLAGLTESVMIRPGGAFAVLRAAPSIHWIAAIDSVLFPHLYSGGWSWLALRSWMYHLLYAVIALAVVGLFRVLRRPEIQWLLAVYLAFWLGLLYHIALLFVTRGVATSMGWYLYAVAGAEIVLCVAGLRALVPGMQKWVAPGGVVLFAAMDLYAMHAMAIPYYAGIIRHKPNGALAGLHLATLPSAGTILERLTAFKANLVSEPLLIVLWLGYLVLSIAICTIAVSSRYPDLK